MRRNPKPQHKNPTEAGDMKKIEVVFFVWQSREVPRSCVVRYYLGWRERKGWRKLTKNPLESKKGDQDKEYVTIKQTEQTKNY